MVTAEDIAVGVAALLNDLVDTTFEFIALLPDAMPEIEREASFATVHVYPYSESEDPQDRGDMVLAVREITVVLTKTLDEGETRAQCLDWLNELKDAFREANIQGYRWQGNETETLYDFDALAQRRQFVSMFRSRFFSFT